MYLPTGRPLALWVYGLLVVSLWATVTNAVPLSVAFAILAPLVPYALTRTHSVPRVVFALLVVYFIFIASTLFYAPLSFVSPAFYRRDGNFFITFMPVLLGGVINLRVDVRRVMVAFIGWSTVLIAALIAVFVATGGTILYYEAGIFHSLFEAHNAAGGFLAMMTAFSIGWLATSRRKALPALALFVHTVGLFLTVSRGSMLGILLAFVLIVILRGRLIGTAVMGIIAVTVAALAYAYPLWVEAGRPWSIQLGIIEGLGTEQAGGADTNIADRLLYLWPRALDVFFESPIVGAGYGSYNDLPYSFAGIPHLFSFNRPVELIFNSSHAHNSYLHVMAECGLVGLVLVLVLLREIWRAIKSFQPGVREGLLIAFWVAVFSACTEHRLFTPSQMLPFTILLGLCLANQRWNARVQAAPNPGPPEESAA